MKSARQPAALRRGFTLIELLVVIGIIVLLIAILLPVVSSVRKQAYNTSTQSQMARIMQACLAYYHDFNAYPGPIANANLAGGATPSNGNITGGTQITNANGGAAFVTSSENLVLGLFGFLQPPPTSGKPISFIGPPQPAKPAPPYQPTGTGVTPSDVASLNFLHPASYHYMDYVPAEMTINGWTATLEYVTGVVPADSNVPEFIDRFPSAMPILYMRANVGIPINTSSQTTIADSIAFTKDTAQYNYAELKPYYSAIYMAPLQNTKKPIQIDDTLLKTLNGSYSPTNNLADDVATPYWDWNGLSKNTASPSVYDGYFVNPNVANSARGTDTFVLIAPGKDRVYGTHDDIIITP